MIRKFLVAGAGLLSVSPAIAQTSAATLTYLPSSMAAPAGSAAEAVPLPGFVLVALGLSLALLGLRALRRHGGRHVLGLVFTLCGIATAVCSGAYVKDSFALVAEIYLGNSSGATVELPIGSYEVINTSGADLVIDSINVAGGCFSNAPANECLAGTELAPLESCFTDYQCLVLVVDTDGDGYDDSVDACPTQGDQGYGVDGTGCPNPVPDSDGDGYPDNVDTCPTQGDQGYGLDITGCPNPVPDSDGDGYLDNVDACPTQGDEGYGVDGSGCPNPVPDSDGDGYLDNVDACPTQGDEGYGIDATGCPYPAT